MRLLLVEDEIDAARMLARGLRDHAYAVDMAYDGEEAVRTALDQVQHRIDGLDSGADDYLTKPFDFGELLARVRALLRRGPALQDAVLAVDDVVPDTRERTVRRAGRRIELTAKEYALLEYLMRRQGEVVGRADISEGAIVNAGYRWIHL